MDNERFEQGTAVRADVLGPEYVAARAAQPTEDPVIANWRRYLAEEGWGGVWARPGLPNKTKSLITVVALAAGGYTHELELHLVGAIRNGWTPAELGDALIHLSSYVGYPPVVAAFRVAEQVFARENIGVAAGATPSS